MMDQILAGLPQAPPAAPPTHRDQQTASSADDAGGGESFEKYVSKAGQNESSHKGRDPRDAAVDAGAKDTAGSDPQTLKTTSLPADLLPRSMTDSSESRIRLALLKQNQKAAAVPDAGKHSDAEKALAKMLDAAKQTLQKATVETVHAEVAAQEVAASPSEELSMLLGLAPSKESTVKPAKKQDADAEKTDGKDEKSAVIADRKSEILFQAGHENAAVAAKGNDTAHGKDDAAAEAVRLVSADGKGRPVDIPLTKTATDSVTDTDKRPNSAKFDTATVVEARRYLGFSQESNTQTLTGAIKSDPTWTEALAHVNRAGLSLEGDTVKEVNTLKLQMNPGDLGNMVASLKLKGDELTVEVRVDTIEAYRHLSADQDGIVKALQDQGFSIDKVSVQLNAPERTEASSDRDFGRQDQNQKGDQGNQPSGRNHNARQGNQNPWTRDEDVGISTAADGRIDSPRASDIYL